MVAGLKLLVVDDEPSLIALLSRFLERAGYSVVVAQSGEDALREFAAQPDSFALVVTDLTMNGMSGEDLVRGIREVRPRIPALVMSGYPHVPRLPNTGFLQKPFLPAMLIEAVRGAIGG